jgi:hypothetical protein
LLKNVLNERSQKILDDVSERISPAVWDMLNEFETSEIEHIECTSYLKGKRETEEEILKKMLFYGFSNEEIHLLTGHMLRYIELAKQNFDRNLYREQQIREEEEMEERRKISAKEREEDFAGLLG